MHCCLNSLHQAGNLCPSLPGQVKSRPMCDAGADDRQAEGDVDRTVEANQFKGDERLIMIKRDHGIKPPLLVLEKDRIRRNWHAALYPLLASLRNRW